MKGGTPPASPRPPASTSRPRSTASAINRLQEALEGTRDRESHLAERVAASVTDGHRSPHAFLRSFKIVAVEERDITSTASLPRRPRAAPLPFSLRSFEISAIGKGSSGRSGAFSDAVATSREGHRSPRSGRAARHRRWDRGRPKPDQRVGPRWGQIHDRQSSTPCFGKRSSREERDRNPKPAAEPASQPMNTEKTNGESTPPAITSFSPARSGASSPRK